MQACEGPKVGEIRVSCVKDNNGYYISQSGEYSCNGTLVLGPEVQEQRHSDAI